MQITIEEIATRHCCTNRFVGFTVRCLVEAFVFRRRSCALARIKGSILTPWKTKPRECGLRFHFPGGKDDRL